MLTQLAGDALDGNMGAGEQNKGFKAEVDWSFELFRAIIIRGYLLHTLQPLGLKFTTFRQSSTIVHLARSEHNENQLKYLHLLLQS